MTKICRISTAKPVLANKGKFLVLSGLVKEVKSDVNKCIQLLWDSPQVPSLPGKHITEQLDSGSSWIRQVAAKQASSVVRSITSKQKKALWRQDNGKKLKKYQQEILNGTKIPTWDGNIELDCRFVDIQKADTSNHPGTDLWLRIRIPKKNAIFVPLKYTNHMKDLVRRGFEMKVNCCRLNKDGSIGLYFYKEVQEKQGDSWVGVDAGMNKAVVTSDGVFESTHKTGHLIKGILAKIQHKFNHRPVKQRACTRYSKAIKKLITELNNQINYSVKNDISWDHQDVLVYENLTNLKTGKRRKTRANLAWRYPVIKSRLEMTAAEHGVRAVSVSPAYTSQTCSCCGHRDEKNRDGEAFVCQRCGLRADADLNAAINILRRGANSPSRSAVKRKQKKSGSVQQT